MTFLGLSYQSCFFITQICETIYVFILDLKKKNKMKKKNSHFNGENLTELDRSLNCTYLKFKELNWTKVKLDDWNEFMWNLKGGFYNYALKIKLKVYH